MQNGCIVHDPVHIIFSRASQEISVVVPGVIIPDGVIDLKCAAAVHGVKNILIRKKQFFRMLFCVGKRLLQQ